ncbi:MAG: protein phosphatase 2C domain-containing protein [Pseudomonadota bacterium]
MAQVSITPAAWFSADAEDGAVFEVAAGGGTAVAFSLVAPAKDSGNEDAVGVVAIDADACILVVADGAGGLPGAQAASQTAMRTVLAAITAVQTPPESWAHAVRQAIDAANDAVMALRNGSATTLTAVLIEGQRARCFHVGDSAAIVSGQRGALRFETVGHSPVSFAVAAGLLSEEQAMFHIDRHIVANFLGNPAMRVDISDEIQLRSRDTVLVCSDGLTDNLLTSEIIAIMRCGPLAEVVPALISVAAQRMLGLEAGMPSKPDDLSLLVFRR